MEPLPARSTSPPHWCQATRTVLPKSLLSISALSITRNSESTPSRPASSFATVRPRVLAPKPASTPMLFYPLAGIPNPSHPHGLDQLADWTYVDDTARGIQLMLDADGLMDRAFNIATGVTIPVSEIMDAVLTHAPVVPDYDIGRGANLEGGTPLDITCTSTQRTRMCY